MIYVFCEDGLWLLHSGIDYKTLIKTFAYSGISLSHAEKNTVRSYGNEVFFMSDSVGYVIRTNKYVESKEDIYVIPITNAVGDLLQKPRDFVKARLQESYGIVASDTSNIYVNYYTKIVNAELYLIASYHISDPIETLMISYIYNKDTRRWRIYDTVAGGFPIFDIASDNMKNFDLVLLNHYVNGYPTYASYIYELPEDFPYTIGDVRPMVKNADGKWVLADSENEVVNSVTPIQNYLDTGSLTLGIDFKKRMRKVLLSLSNILGTDIGFTIVPYSDGVALSYPLSVDAYIDSEGAVQESLTVNLLRVVTNVKFVLDSSIFSDPQFVLSNSALTRSVNYRLDAKTNLLGRTLGFKLYIPATNKYSLLQYSIVYRSLNAR